MAIPLEKDIELPLLREIEDAGGEARPSDLYDRVARHFPQLTQADREARYERTGQLIWPNRVQFARNDLLKNGEVDASTRGIWRITDRGRARLGVVSPPSLPSLTPTPTPSTIGELLDKERQQIRAQLHESLMNLHPQQFEAFAGKLLESIGFTDVEVTQYVGDGGIDGHGNFEMGVVRVRAAFQVKRWRQNVSRPEIQQFRGAIQGAYDYGIFITTSDFSDEAKRISSVPGAVPVHLIDGAKVLDIMLEKGLGVRQEPLTVTRIDEEFFAAFGISEE